ncbi:flavin-containing monooxygenase [Conexibacter woesei]|nr:NAD(P)/FAD-dependent oxidoreductase [Conexibacter woesei]
MSDVVIVGAGFGGLGTAMRLRQEGIDDFTLLERAGDVGGVWRANTYPGCACDVPSPLYSFSFEPNPDWSRLFSPQPEIHAYLRRCAERHDLRRHIRFGCELTAATWDDAAQRWRLDTTQGPLTARVLVSALGPLTEPQLPDVPGLAEFPGELFHSAAWDHTVDLTGKRVAVVGTGSSAIQFVPQIQPRVGSLHLLQRTPGWVLPHVDRPTGRVQRFLLRRVPALGRLQRAAVYWGMEGLVTSLLRQAPTLRALERLARWNIRRHVADPELRRKLTPDFRLGCKRILASNTYYRALAAPNAEVLTGGVREVRGATVVAGDGSEREVDAIVLGTGYGVLGNPAYGRIRGRDGRALSEVWHDGAESYLGTTVAGFPNLFTIIGPNTGLGAGSMVYVIEAQIAYVLDALRRMRERGVASIEVRAGVQRRFNDELQQRMRGTVWTAGGCASWYLDSDGCNRTLWPGQTYDFRRRTSRVDMLQYRVRTASTPAVAAATASADEAVPS